MNQIENSLINNIKTSVKQSFDYEPKDNEVMVEIPKDNTNGDYATNIAMRLAKVLHKNPKEIANVLVDALKKEVTNADKIEVAGPGFINFYMKKSALSNIINTIIEKDHEYGKSESGKGHSVLLEYVSANPTGILHLGHARGAAWGDSVARILKAAGYEVLREYYVNDAGNQIDMLALSIKARYREYFGLDFKIPDDGYMGKDVQNIAIKIAKEEGDKWLKEDDEVVLPYFKKRGKELEMERIKNDLAYFRCEFDNYFFETSLYEDGKVEKVVNILNEKGLSYEKEGALWFKASEYGDEKDRVLKKSDGFYTYLTPDIAYHVDKLKRGYETLVNLWGADHHGYIPRMKAALKALGYDEGRLEVDIIQMVRLVENGEEVKMSKRTGNAVTLRELCEDIGVDAARYFFISRALDTHLDFDLGLARKKSNDNPVYYIQYAHARISSILRQVGEFKLQDSYNLLTSEKESDLLKQLSEFSNVVAASAKDRSPNKITVYLQKLAQYFHAFYASCKVNDPGNLELTNERAALLKATQITFRNALDLLGIEAPEVM